MIFIGTAIYGSCGGRLDVPEYITSRIEAFGVDWLVVRPEAGSVQFVSFDCKEDLLAFVEQGSKKQPKDDWGY